MHQFDEQPHPDANQSPFSGQESGEESGVSPLNPFANPGPEPDASSEPNPVRPQWPWEPAGHANPSDASSADPFPTPAPSSAMPTPDTDTPEAPDPPHATGEGTLNLLDDLEARLNRLREAATGAPADLEHERHELECRKREVEEKAENLREWEAHLNARQAALEADSGKAYDDHQDVARQREALEDAQRDLDARREAFNVQLHDLERAREEIVRRENELNDRCHHDGETHRRDHDDERINALESEKQAIQEQLAQATGERDWANAAMEDLRQERVSLQNELDSVRAELEARSNASHEAVSERQGDIERLTNLNERLEARIAELELALAESRKGPEPNDSLAREIEAKQHELDACLQRIQEMESREQERTSVTEQLQSLEAELQARDARITALESELREVKMSREAAVAQLQAELATAQSDVPTSVKEELEIARRAVAEREEAIKDLANRFRTLQTTAAETRAAAQQADESYQAQIQQLREDTEARVEQARLEGEEAGRASVPPVPVGPTEGQQLRRERLHAYRQALARRRNNLKLQKAKVKEAAEKVRGLDGTRQSLIECQQALEKMERRMVRRWARPKATTHAFMMVLMVLLVAGASYFGVMEFWPVPYVVNAAVEAKGDPGVALNPEQKNAWQDVHVQMIMSDQVLDATAERMRQRGLVEMANREVLDPFFEEHLTYDTSEPGKITFHMTGTNTGETTRLLETYLLAFMSESNASRSLRADRAKTRVLTPATADPVPVEDPRLVYAGYTFGGSLATVLLFMTLFYVRLTQVKKVLDIDDELFAPMLDDGEWERISQGKSDVDGLVLD